MPRLHIYETRERRLVAAADRLLGFGAAIRRTLRRRRRPARPARVLVLRLERIGDLLMTVPAITDIVGFAPDAEIHLAVGSWNLPIAKAIAAVDRVLVLDAQWLAREGGGFGIGSLLSTARAWRSGHYDLAINFEPDIRSNLVLAASGARWTVGYRSGGGGALLDVSLDYDITAHTTDNARGLIAAAFEAPAPGRPWTQGTSLIVGPDAQSAAGAILAPADGPLVGVHASGGRAVKQWDVERFGDVARRLIEERGATAVLTGSAADRPLVDRVKAMLPAGRVIDVAGDLDLVALAAVLERLDLFVTGDTGPMHLAHAVGTPIVAVFGPSDPARYAPRGRLDRIVRVDLPCSPCNRIRIPPARCTGHTPDCLAFVNADSVFTAAVSVLDAAERDRADGIRA